MNKPASLNDLKAKINMEINKVTIEELKLAVENLKPRLQCVIEQNGGSIENFL